MKGISRELLGELYWKRGMSTRKIANMLDTYQRAIILLMKRYGIPRRNRIEAVIKGCRKYIKSPFSGDMKEKAYIMGLAFADFRIRKHGYQIDVTLGTTHPSFTLLFKKLFEKYAPIREYQYYNKWSKQYGWRLETQLHKTFDFLLGPKHMPKWVMNNHDAFLNFTAGYTDGEGIISICKNSKKCVSFIFAISSEDIQILSCIFNGLKGFGFKPSLRVLRKTGETNNFYGNHLVYKKDYWMLRLKRKGDVLRFLEILPIRHPERVKKRELMFKLKDKIYIKDVMHHWLKLKNEIKLGINEYLSEAELKIHNRLNSSNNVDALS